MTTFISGPSNSDFETVRQQLLISGFDTEIVTPEDIDYTNPLYTGLPGSGFREQLARLSICDKIVFLPGWEQRRGCIAELLTATLCGTKTFEIGAEGTVKATLHDRYNINGTVERLLQENTSFHMQEKLETWDEEPIAEAAKGSRLKRLLDSWRR